MCIRDRFNPEHASVTSQTIAPDARAAGMGDVGAATDPDVASQYWNLSLIHILSMPSGTRSSLSREGSLMAFVKLDSEGDEPLTLSRCRVWARYGNLFVAEIPLERLGHLSLDRHVMRIETGHRPCLLYTSTGVFDKVMVAPSSTARSATFHAMDFSLRAPKTMPLLPFNKLLLILSLLIKYVQSYTKNK